MLTCVLPTGCIASPNCTGKCQLSVLEESERAAVVADPSKLAATVAAKSKES